MLLAERDRPFGHDVRKLALSAAVFARVQELAGDLVHPDDIAAFGTGERPSVPVTVTAGTQETDGAGHHSLLRAVCMFVHIVRS